MTRIRSTLIAAAAMFALAACGDASAPTGRTGALRVNAYVDRDASGTLTAADSAISGVTVTATPASGAARTAVTDAGGAATFADLRPGTYTLALGATGVPAGTVLISNPAPTAVVSFQGQVRPVDFRFSFYPGSLSGRLYRDDDGNGTFDATDTPGAGLYVVIKRDSAGVMGATVDSVTAGDDGAYTFARLAPGSYFLVFEQPDGIDFGTAGATRRVTVTAGAPTAEIAVFTGSLVVPIRQARLRPEGANVEVEGVVTVAAGTFISGTGGVNSEIWVQDTSGGIAVFPVPSNSGIGLGTVLRVRGPRDDFNAQEQIGTSTAPPTITILDTVAPLAPRVVTGAAVNARTNEGELVTLSGYTVTSVPTGTSTAFSVSGTAPDGQTVVVRVSNGTGVTRSNFVVGTRYTIRGILSEFNGTAQIKVRGPADVAGPTPIATVRTGTSGTVYTVAGVLTAAPGSFTSGTNGINSEIWVQDATGGIAVFSVPTADSLTLAIGDRIEVTGTLSAFSGQLQLSSSPQVTRLGAGTAVTPRAVSGAELLARTYEGQLVNLPTFTVVSVQTGTATSFNVTGTAADGSTIVLRITGPTSAQDNAGLTRADFTVGARYSVTGLATVFSTSTSTTVQLKPRMRADVTPLP